MTYILDILGMSEEDRLEVKNTLFDLCIKRNDMKSAKELTYENQNFSIKGD